MITPDHLSGTDTLAGLLLTALQRDTLPALSLTQPWATLVAHGAKRQETRTWGTRYRGPLAIHASKSLPEWAEACCFGDPFGQTLHAAGYHHDAQQSPNSWNLPLGQVIALVWLEEVWQVNERTQDRVPDRDSQEYAFGNYTTGRSIWTFSALYRLTTPIPARGTLGVWEWTPTEACWQELQDHLDHLRGGRS